MLTWALLVSTPVFAKTVTAGQGGNFNTLGDAIEAAQTDASIIEIDSMAKGWGDAENATLEG